MSVPYDTERAETEMRRAKGWPYCQHPECHNSRTVEYWEQGTGNGWPLRLNPCAGFTSYTRDQRVTGFRRWCHTHALLNEGWALGGAA